MTELNEAAMREYAKSLKISDLWRGLGEILQPVVTLPVIGKGEPVTVFDDRTKDKLTDLQRRGDWGNLLKIVRSFVDPNSNYHGSFRLMEEVDERAFQNYPHDFSRLPMLASSGFKYFGDIREKGQAYNEKYVLMGELVRRARGE